jgi:triosephosphate isomerase
MKTIVVANWKMNPETFLEAKALFDGTRKATDTARNVSVVIAPPLIFLRELTGQYRGKKIEFAAQNGYFEKTGAYTGEISLAQIKDAGASYVIVGHGERRAMGETNEDTRKKIAAAVNLKMTPILCVGEKERVKDGGHFEIVREQLNVGLMDVPPTKLRQVMVMYEPLWAVGSGTPVAPRDMHEMSIFIKKVVVEKFGEVGHTMRILYGGSVTHENARAMIDEAGVQGFIVGGASLDIVKFTSLLKSLS